MLTRSRADEARAEAQQSSNSGSAGSMEQGGSMPDNSGRFDALDAPDNSGKSAMLAARNLLSSMHDIDGVV